jgi:hypothetical protein
MNLTRPLRKATLVTAAFLAAVVWACSGHVAAARGQDEATSRPAQERGGDNAAHPTMHLTGCVERGVIPGSFMLTQVRVAGTDGVAGGTETGRPPGTSGTSDGRSMAGERPDAHAVPADRYTLRSLERGTDLGEFVGKRVAITGRLTADRDQTGLGARGTDGQVSGDDTPTRSDRPGGTSAGGATAAAANIRQLDAETIRSVAGTCSPATDRR